MPNPDTDDTDTTTSTATRYPYTNDIAAVFLIVSFCAAVVGGAYAVATGRINGDIDVNLLLYGYIALVLLAGTWLFGHDALDALGRLRK